MRIALTQQGFLNTRYAYSRAWFPRSRSVPMCMYLTCRWYIQTNIRTHNRTHARTHARSLARSHARPHRRARTRTQTHLHTQKHTNTHTQAAVINATKNADIRSHPSFFDMRFRWWLCQDILKEGKSPQVAHVVFHQVFCTQCLTYAQGSSHFLSSICLPCSRSANCYRAVRAGEKS